MMRAVLVTVIKKKDSIAFHTHVTLVDFVKQGPATKLVASGVCVCLTLSL